MVDFMYVIQSLAMPEILSNLIIRIRLNLQNLSQLKLGKKDKVYHSH